MFYAMKLNTACAKADKILSIKYLAYYYIIKSVKKLYNLRKVTLHSDY